ncbi:hypothetical protein C8R46DRAFT_1125363 [Mycena filopes]|nr:hypothetical protein C8R46DRAFT_1125363 [Mycena filopes]
MDSLQKLVTLRYVVGGCFTALVYDHFATIPDEVNTIWNNPRVTCQSMAAFVLNRYLTEAIMAYVVYVFSGTATSMTTTVVSSRCRSFIWIYGAIGIVVAAIIHFIIIIRVYTLWDRRVSVARTLTSAFAVCISTSAILGIFAVIHIKPEVKYLELLHTCEFGSKPRLLPPALGVLAFFDFFLLVLIVLNAMDRPRLTQFEIVSGLQKDGLGFFLLSNRSSVLRLASFIVSLFRSTTEVFTTMTLVWGISTIMNARLHMRLEGLALSRSRGPVVMYDEMQNGT